MHWSYSQSYKVICSSFDYEFDGDRLLKDTIIHDIETSEFLESEYLKILEVGKEDTIYGVQPLIKCKFKVNGQDKSICLGTTDILILNGSETSYQSKKLTSYIQNIVWPDDY